MYLYVGLCSDGSKAQGLRKDRWIEGLGERQTDPCEKDRLLMVGLVTSLLIAEELQLEATSENEPEVRNRRSSGLHFRLDRKLSADADEVSSWFCPCRKASRAVESRVGFTLVKSGFFRLADAEPGAAGGESGNETCFFDVGENNARLQLKVGVIDLTSGEVRCGVRLCRIWCS